MSTANTSKDFSGTMYSLVCDSDGYLKVAVQSGAAGSATDDAAFTPATGTITVIGAFADEAGPDSVDEGDAGAVRMSLDRMLLSQVSGRAAEDAAAAGNPVLCGGRYDSTARALETGDAGALALDVAGRALVVGPAAEDAAVVGGPVLVGGRYDSTNRDLDNGDVGGIALNADAQVIVDDAWRPSLQAEEAADDSDKSLTVPASTQWRIKSIWVELTSSGDAGNRVISVEIQDGSADVIFRVDAGAVQAASLTRYYSFAGWQADLTAFRGAGSDLLMTPIPPDLVLPAAYVVRVYDSAVIAAAADDMIVQMLVEARTV